MPTALHFECCVVMLMLQELNKLLPMADSPEESELDKPAQYQEVDDLESAEDGKQFHIKISPLARPYISFGPDIRQHPCATSARAQKMYETSFPCLCNMRPGISACYCLHTMKFQLLPVA